MTPPAIPKVAKLKGKARIALCSKMWRRLALELGPIVYPLPSKSSQYNIFSQKEESCLDLCDE